MAVPEVPPRPLVSPHPSEKVLSRISSFHRPRPNLNLPPIPPRTPPAALRQAHRAQVPARRREAKKNNTTTEFTKRAMLQAQGNAEDLAHSPTTTPTSKDTESPTESIDAAEQLTEILPHHLPPHRGTSGLLHSPRPVFALSPTYRARGPGRSMIPVAVAGSPLMYREVVKRPVMLPTKEHDGRGRKRERVLGWGVASPAAKRGVAVGSGKEEVGAVKKEVEG
ncbi:uncharacterized protein H6S33_007271 [Morchella sextelata]|uniref:uncharacterized protein n=1 Tax=Morchella sextelata TaxID=1174677 RepID=UPI001D044CE8|nr:uncharacterized protein H6S33_007271 [Morchella sextelata]KAH0603612.1 hypothetical protein H6S33_007271 [Morchella sextelata]